MKIHKPVICCLLFFPLTSFGLITLSTSAPTIAVQQGQTQVPVQAGRQAIQTVAPQQTAPGFVTGINTPSAHAPSPADEQALINAEMVGSSIGKDWQALDLIPDIARPVSYRQLRELMIYESNIATGECACPYSPDQYGGRCGTRAAYYMPHPCKIYCFPSDISNNAVYFYWLNNALPCEKPGCYDPHGTCLP